MPEIFIRESIQREDILGIISRHRIVYEEFGFNSEFGDYVKQTLKEPPLQLWIAESEGKFLGCIGVTHLTPGQAQLRWFLVEPEARGLGIGKRLAGKALQFCRKKKYKNICLWTVNKLPAARRIYEDAGFRLTETKPETLLWGQLLVEERWDLSLEENR